MPAGRVHHLTVTDEVLDVEQLQDRFREEVTKVGDDLEISVKVPIADFQDILIDCISSLILVVPGLYSFPSLSVLDH